MLTKKNMWYMTLFSIILVMAVYYVSFSEKDLKKVSNDVKTEEKALVTIKESENLTALRVSRDEKLEKEMAEVKKILNDETKTSEEKSDAYEALKKLTTNKGKSSSIETDIKKEFDLDAFVNIDTNKIKIVINSKKHSFELANKIMNFVQKEFEEKMYITITFEDK